MRWLKAASAAALLLLLGALVMVLVQAPEPGADEPSPTVRSQLKPPVARQPLPGARADIDELRRIERVDGVTTQRGRPSLSHYTRDVVMATVQGIARWFEGMGVSGNALITVIAWIIATVALMAIATIAWRFLRRWTGRRQATSESATIPLDTPTPAAVDWRRRLDTALREGRARDALEALWWWFAERLGAASVDPAWTTRELIGHAGRSDLWPLVSRFDRLIYGYDEPDIDDVRSLLESVRRAVANPQAAERVTS